MRWIFVGLLAAVVVGVGLGCSSGGDDDNAWWTPPPGGGGGGGGGGPTNGTVPGNAQLGLATSPEAPRIPGGTQDERMVANQINQYRQQNGRSALAWSDDMADAARSHAYDCAQAGYFGHGSRYNPGNYNIAVQRGQWLYQQGFSDLEGYYWECGYSGGASGAVSGWINSNAHRQAILDTGLVGKHGVGIGPKGNYVFWVSCRR